MYSSHCYADTCYLGSRGYVHREQRLASLSLHSDHCVQENDRLSHQVQTLSVKVTVSDAYRIRARQLERSKTSAALQVRVCHCFPMFSDVHELKLNCYTHDDLNKPV